MFDRQGNRTMYCRWAIAKDVESFEEFLLVMFCSLKPFTLRISMRILHIVLYTFPN